TRQNPRAGHFQTLEADSVPKALKIIQKLDGCLDVAREPHTAEKREELGVILRVEVVMTDYGTLLRDHVTLRCRSIDRIFLQAYVPKLQTVGWVCTFLRWQRKFKIPSSAAFGKIGEEYVKAIYRFAEARHIPVVHFKKGQDKEKVARPYLEAAAQE